MMKSTLPVGILGFVASMLAATFNKGHSHGKHRMWNIVTYIWKYSWYVATFTCNAYSGKREIIFVVVIFRCIIVDYGYKVPFK